MAIARPVQKNCTRYFTRENHGFVSLDLQMSETDDSVAIKEQITASLRRRRRS
jgi:hypothetical protein